MAATTIDATFTRGDASRRSRLTAALAPGLLALIAVSVLAGFDLAARDWDITLFLRVGEHSSARPFITDDIPDTEIVAGWGHDGQANYVLAATFPDMPAAEGHLDSVTYRARRIVYPALLSLVPRGRALASAMLMANLAAVVVAAIAVGHLAVRAGASRRVGAIVGVTPAFVTSAVLDLGDGLAIALTAGGVVLWRRSETTRAAMLAVALLTLGALTRETTLVVTAAMLLVAVGDDRTVTRRSWVLLVPGSVVVAWIVALEIWIGGPGKSATQFALPFRGWFDSGIASRETLGAAALVALSAWVAHRLWAIDRVFALVVAAEGALLCCVDQAVLFHTLNLARVTPWVVPWAAIVLVAQNDRSIPHVQRLAPSFRPAREDRSADRPQERDRIPEGEDCIDLRAPERTQPVAHGELPSDQLVDGRLAVADEVDPLDSLAAPGRRLGAG